MPKPAPPLPKSAVDLNMKDPLAQSALFSAVARLSPEVTDTVRQAIREQLHAGYTAGEGQDEIAARLQKVFDATMSRARTIARTEINGAASAGRDIQVHKNFGENFEQEWLTARDSRVRHSHAACDGVRVKSTGTFPNGLNRPHQPGAPAREVINCRCVRIIYPTDESAVTRSSQPPPVGPLPEYYFKGKLTSVQNAAEVVEGGLHQREEHLLHTPVASTSGSPGHTATEGVTFINFKDGSKAAFKPAAGENTDMSGRTDMEWGYLIPRELGYEQVAHYGYMTDLTMPVVKYNFKGSDGVLMDWAPGVKAENTDRVSAADGRTDLGRIAVLDYLTGHEDRHLGNWYVEGSGADSQLHLIDNGYAFGESEYFREKYNDFIIHKAMSTVPFDEAKKYLQPYIANEDKIVKALTEVGLLPDAVKGFTARLKRFQNANDWRDLFDKKNRQWEWTGGL